MWFPLGPTPRRTGRSTAVSAHLRLASVPYEGGAVPADVPALLPAVAFVSESTRVNVIVDGQAELGGNETLMVPLTAPTRNTGGVPLSCTAPPPEQVLYVATGVPYWNPS